MTLTLPDNPAAFLQTTLFDLKTALKLKAVEIVPNIHKSLHHSIVKWEVMKVLVCEPAVKSLSLYLDVLSA